MDAAFENADKKLHEQLNFRLDNFDARNVRQLADLRDEIKALRGKSRSTGKLVNLFDSFIHYHFY